MAGASLAKAAVNARALYGQHRDQFGYLSQLNGKHRIEIWNKLERGERIMERGEVTCVYREKVQKGNCFNCFNSVVAFDILKLELYQFPGRRKYMTASLQSSRRVLRRPQMMSLKVRNRHQLYSFMKA